MASSLDAQRNAVGVIAALEPRDLLRAMGRTRLVEAELLLEHLKAAEGTLHELKMCQLADRARDLP